tara:strand:- start:94 stop:312 length:219 start_codon:yes stop_codon:yes gene_type:complete
LGQWTVGDSLAERRTDEGALLLSKVPGGCGKELRYFDGHDDLYSENGPIWCGMALMSIEGYFVVCPECHVPS